MAFAVSASATERGIRELQERDRLARLHRMQEQRQADRNARRERQVREWFSAATICADVLCKDDPGEPATRHHSLTIIRAIAAKHHVRISDIKGEYRGRKVVAARQHAIYEVARLCPHLSLPQIGRVFHRDHTTCLHAIRAWPAKAAALGIKCEPINRGAE